MLAIRVSGGGIAHRLSEETNPVTSVCQKTPGRQKRLNRLLALSPQHVHVHVLPRKAGDFERNDSVYNEVSVWIFDCLFRRQTGGANLHHVMDTETGLIKALLHDCVREFVILMLRPTARQNHRWLLNSRQSCQVTVMLKSSLSS